MGFFSRNLINVININVIDDAEEDDSDGNGGVGGEDSDDGRDYSWKKTIMIGPSYQASVPGGLSSYGDTLPYGNYNN